MRLVEQQGEPRRSRPPGEQYNRAPARERGPDLRYNDRGRGSHRGYQGGRTSDGRVICYKCNRVGHYAVACEERNQENNATGRNTPPRLATLREAHEQKEWHDTWKQYSGAYRNEQNYAKNRWSSNNGWNNRRYGRHRPQDEGVSVDLSSQSVGTIGVLEVRAMVNGVEGQTIIDTGACVSCIDETLVRNGRDPINPVYGVNMKTATDEPVQIIGRTMITLQISKCIIRFPVFVARGLGRCCILGNDFHLRFETVIDYSRKIIRLRNASGRMITAPFLSVSKEAKYLRPSSHSSWLNQIQLEEVKNSEAGSAVTQSSSYKILKITSTSPYLTAQCVTEPELELISEESRREPQCLVKDTPAEEQTAVDSAGNPENASQGGISEGKLEVEGVREDEPYEDDEGHREETVFKETNSCSFIYEALHTLFMFLLIVIIAQKSTEHRVKTESSSVLALSEMIFAVSLMLISAVIVFGSYVRGNKRLIVSYQRYKSADPTPPCDWPPTGPPITEQRGKELRPTLS